MTLSTHTSNMRWSRTRQTQRRTFLYILSALALLITMASLSTTTNAQRQADALQRINSSGELKVGYVVFPPWIIKDANTGALSGSYVETIQEIARLMPVKLTFVEASWATFVAGLQTGQFDLSIVPSLSPLGAPKWSISRDRFPIPAIPHL